MQHLHKFNRAYTLFDNGKDINEVAQILHITKQCANKWRKGYVKNKKANIEQLFKTDFACGRVTIKELSKKYGVDRRVLLKLKHKYFGKGSLKEKRMYQMYISGVPTRAIANFYACHQNQVNRAIRKHAQKTP